MSSRDRQRAFIGGGSVIAGLLAGAVPALASDYPTGESITDPHSLLNVAAPSVLGGDSPQTSVSIGAASKARLASPPAESVPVTLTVSPKDSAPESVAVKLDTATTTDFANQSGLSSFSTTSDNVKRYIVENAIGASVITAYQSPQSTYKSSTTFALPEAFHAQKQPSGVYYFTNGEEIRGAIMPPWARDAKGRALETSCSWDGPTLIQDVKVPSDAALPIIADPAWSYTWTAIIKIGDPLSLRTHMHSCFNCTFPVQGAPAAFPIHGQTLPLTVGIAGINMNFTCIFDQESYTPRVPQLYPNGEFGFWFNSGPGHVDGPGSRISFDFWTRNESDTSIKMRFTVVGDITNDSPGGVPQWIYLPGTKAQWEVFVRRVIVTEGGPVSTLAQNAYWNWIN